MLQSGQLSSQGVSGKGGGLERPEGKKAFLSAFPFLFRFKETEDSEVVEDEGDSIV